MDATPPAICGHDIVASYPRWQFVDGTAYTILDDRPFAVSLHAGAHRYREGVYTVWRADRAGWTTVFDITLDIANEGIRDLEDEWNQLHTKLPEMIMEHLL